MVNQIIHINKKKYAVGLVWQPIGSGFSARNYARSLAHSINKKLNLFAESHSMVGLGSYRFGQYGGMPVAAAEIMNGLSEYSSFLAAFLVDNGFYIVAVRNGVILQDIFLSLETDAREEFSRLAQLPDWGALIAPEIWSMPRAVERQINKVVSNSARVLLHPISRFRTTLWPLFALLIFLAVVFIFFREPINQIRKTDKIDPSVAEEYQRRLEEKNKELDQQFEIEKTEVKPIVLPYDNLPEISARAEQCYQAIGFLMQPIAGWNQKSVECNGKYVVAQMERDFGTLGDFYMLASNIIPNSFVQEHDENNVTVTAVLPTIETYSSQDERDAESVVRDVTTMFQMLDSPLNIESVVDTLTNGVDTVLLNVVEIAAQSKMTPMQFMKMFDNFGGVYMTRCMWNAVNRIWNYEVIIYAK